MNSSDRINLVQTISQRRRGSAYVLVLSISMIVTVLGMGALTLSRVSGQQVAQSSNWETAGAIAFSATEDAISVINAQAAASPASWRSAYTNGQTAFTASSSNGTLSWALKDPINSTFTADYLASFRIYGIGKVGNVTRVYSVLVTPGGSPLDVLRTAIHSSSSIAITSGGANVQAINGPISSNSSISLAGTMTGGIEAASISGSASGTQTDTVPAPAKTMPSTAVYSDLLQLATPLGCGSTIQNCLISPSSNPYGAVNPYGIYSVTATGATTLAISNCRIVGTLLISFAGNSTLNLSGPVEWEPGSPSYPILVVSANKATVNITGSKTWLSESSAGVNLNPPGAPYNGTTNTTATDDFPPEYKGVMYLMCGNAGSVVLNNNAYIVGTVISTSAIQMASGETTLVQNPIIYSNPPFGFSTGNLMTEVPGSWRWDKLPQ